VLLQSSARCVISPKSVKENDFVMIQTEAKDSINMTNVSTQEGAKEIEMAEAVTTTEDKDEAMHMDMDAD
jgi:hypothetical protein